MQLNRVKVHKHLGITLEYSMVGQENVTMLEYTNEIIDTFDKADKIGVGAKSSDVPDIF